MSTTGDLLATQPVFADLGPELLERLAERASSVLLTADQRLFSTGEPADRCYLIRSGRIALDLVKPGGPPLTVDTYGSGSLVGMSWLVPPYRWYLDARAVQATEVLALDGAWLRQACEDDPRVGYRVLQQLAHEMYQRMQSARVRLLDVYGPPGAR
jgi:CRP/FNR family cyclic AMP-dependent transcriptional regulator